MMPISERFLWALEVLAIQPHDRVLEIGCGTGIAADLVARKLKTGQITAIDRSAAMVKKARALNRESITAERAVILEGPLGSLSLPARSFTKAFAFNVSSFWTEHAARELKRLQPLLKKPGAFYLFHQPPTDKTEEIARTAKRCLEEAGFSVQQVLFKDLPPAPASCIVAENR